MKPKTLMMLVVAGGCGLVALLGFQSMQGGSKAKVETARVLVVIDAVDVGEEGKTWQKRESFPKLLGDMSPSNFGKLSRFCQVFPSSPFC